MWASITNTKDGAHLRALPFPTDVKMPIHSCLTPMQVGGYFTGWSRRRRTCHQISQDLPTIVLHAEKFAYLRSSPNICRVPEKQYLFREKRTSGNIVYPFIQRTGKLGWAQQSLPGFHNVHRKPTAFFCQKRPSQPRWRWTKGKIRWDQVNFTF